MTARVVEKDCPRTAGDEVDTHFEGDTAHGQYLGDEGL